ncbi:hypothetical protein PSACC_01050 [Paramicrosporidium saccamoebae]|uniref:Uncharacterized protein n=1 Tax=Paramicrosporidium saccamoebae TaxID=1246581 RepID=A0A2H9TN25_9FUNG|nr:hypothetical protein PSACC_01050 [Paramicrosporidium saccamoebae]
MPKYLISHLLDRHSVWSGHIYNGSRTVISMPAVPYVTRQLLVLVRLFDLPALVPLWPSLIADLFHWDCLEAELERNGEQMLSRAKCPVCRVAVLPSGNSPLLAPIRAVVDGTKWAGQLPDKTAKERDPLLPGAPQTQPNGPEMVAIEIGQRVEFGRRQPDDPKLHAPPKPRRLTLAEPEEGPAAMDQLKSILRIILNCIMLRNVRMFSLGASPRQTLLIIGIICLVLFFGVHFVLPMIDPTLA